MTSRERGPTAQVSVIKRIVSTLGVTLALGVVLPLFGCGGAGGRLVGRGDADMPEGIARDLRYCAAQHFIHLGSTRHAVSFDVKLTEGGDVDTVSLRDSDLGDEPLEVCMASALKSLSQDDIPLRQSSNRHFGPPSPESRRLLGQEEVLACLISPPCLLTLGLFVGAAYIAIQVFVQATSASSTAKPKPHAAPIATTVPTAADDVLDYEKRCWPFFEACLDNMDQPAWNQKTYGPKKDCGACLRLCKNHAKGVWPDEKCPP